MEGRKVEIEVGLRRQMLYSFTYMSNLKKKTTIKKTEQTKPNKIRLMETETIDVTTEERL